jgi:hypothetical protein
VHPEIVGARPCVEHQSQRVKCNGTFDSGSLLRLVCGTIALQLREGTGLGYEDFFSRSMISCIAKTSSLSLSRHEPCLR